MAISANKPVEGDETVHHVTPSKKKKKGKPKKFPQPPMTPMIDVIKKLRSDYEKEFGATVSSAGAGGKEGDDKRMFFLEIRADERVNWQDVAPVIRAGVEAGINKMNITALTARIGE